MSVLNVFIGSFCMAILLHYFYLIAPSKSSLILKEKHCIEKRNIKELQEKYFIENFIFPHFLLVQQIWR